MRRFLAVFLSISGVVAVPAQAALHAEAGFVDVPGQKVGSRNSARMFYSFRPADRAAESKPLAVIFNGGPGFATTLKYRQVTF